MLLLVFEVNGTFKPGKWRLLGEIWRSEEFINLVLTSRKERLR